MPPLDVDVVVVDVVVVAAFGFIVNILLLLPQKFLIIFYYNEKTEFLKQLPYFFSKHGVTSSSKPYPELPSPYSFTKKKRTSISGET